MRTTTYGLGNVEAMQWLFGIRDAPPQHDLHCEGGSLRVCGVPAQALKMVGQAFDGAKDRN
jgi:hypothetical protein